MKTENKTNIIRNYFYILSYKILAIIVPLITTPYIARVLSAESIGAFSYSQSIATYFSLFGIMGMNLYGQLQVTKNRENKENLSNVFWELFIAKTITSVICIIIYSVFVFVYRKYTSLLLIMGIMIIANVFDISWFFHGLEDFKRIVIRNYIIKIAELVLILIFVRSEDDVLIYAIIVQGATLLGNISLWYRIYQFIEKQQGISYSHIISHLKRNLMFFIPAITTTISMATDKVMLGAITKSDYENGLYFQAFKIEQFIITIIASMSSVLLPRLVFLHSSNDEETMNKYISKAIAFAGMIEIPIMCGLYAVADIFIPVFLGNQFKECIALIRIFSVLIFINGINTILGDTCLVAQGKQGQYNKGVFAGAVMNILLNALLIPLLQSKGAAIGSLISEITVFGFFLHYTHNAFISLIGIIKKWIKYFIAAIIMGFIVWQIGRIFGEGIKTLIIQVASGVFLYVTLVLVLRDKEALLALKTIWKNKNPR